MMRCCVLAMDKAAAFEKQWCFLNPNHTSEEVELNPNNFSEATVRVGTFTSGAYKTLSVTFEGTVVMQSGAWTSLSYSVKVAAPF